MKLLSQKIQMLLVLLIVFSLGACAEKEEETVPAHETFTIDSSEMNETRVINVYLPPDYDKSDTKNFPVLYMPDGGLKEDFPHIATTIDKAIRTGEMQQVILVGIENTERRRDMTPPTEVAKDREVAPTVGKSATFRAFIAQELIPQIQTRYRTTGDSGIIGESLAGLFIVEIFFLQPELFDKYIALSPSLWWNNQELVRLASQRLLANPDLDIDLYLSAANETDIAPHVSQLAEVLRKDAPAHLRWHYEPREDLRHNNIYRTVSPQVLRKMYPVQ